VSDISYIPQEVRLTFLVTTDQYAAGDYAWLHGNGGAGAIDTGHPLTRTRIDLYPGRQVMGWGEIPWGEGSWGEGGSYLNVVYAVAEPGDWSFQFSACDAAGNPHDGTPAAAGLPVSLTPNPPPALRLVSYDPDTDILTLREK